MSKICDFGSANHQKEKGYRGIGTIKDTEEGALKKFFSDDVRLVKGANINNSNVFEFYIMVKNKLETE